MDEEMHHEPRAYISIYQKGKKQNQMPHFEERDFTRNLLKLLFENEDEQEEELESNNPEALTIAQKIIKHMEHIFQQHYEEVQLPLIQCNKDLQQKLESIRQLSDKKIKYIEELQEQRQKLISTNETLSAEIGELHYTNELQELKLQQIQDKCRLLQLEIQKLHEENIGENSKLQNSLNQLQQKIQFKEQEIQELKAILTEREKIAEELEKSNLSLKESLKEKLEERQFRLSSLSPSSLAKIETQENDQSDSSNKYILQENYEDNDKEFQTMMEQQQYVDLKDFNEDNKKRIERFNSSQQKNDNIPESNAKSKIKSIHKDSIRIKSKTITASKPIKQVFSNKKESKQKMEPFSEKKDKIKQKQQKGMPISQSNKQFSMMSSKQKAEEKSKLYSQKKLLEIPRKMNSASSESIKSIFIERVQYKKELQEKYLQKIQKLQKKAKHKDTEIKNLTNQLSDLKAKTDRFQNQITIIKHQIEERDEELALHQGQGDNIIQELREKLKYYKNQLRRLQQQFIIQKSMSQAYRNSLNQFQIDSNTERQNHQIAYNLLKQKFKCFISSQMNIYQSRCSQLQLMLQNVISQKGQSLSNSFLQSTKKILKKSSSCQQINLQNFLINQQQEIHHMSNENSQIKLDKAELYRKLDFALKENNSYQEGNQQEIKELKINDSDDIIESGAEENVQLSRQKSIIEKYEGKFLNIIENVGGWIEDYGKTHSYVQTEYENENQIQNQTQIMKIEAQPKLYCSFAMMTDEIQEQEQLQKQMETSQKECQTEKKDQKEECMQTEIKAFQELSIETQKVVFDYFSSQTESHKIQETQIQTDMNLTESTFSMTDRLMLEDYQIQTQEITIKKEQINEKFQNMNATHCQSQTEVLQIEQISIQTVFEPKVYSQQQINTNKLQILQQSSQTDCNESLQTSIQTEINLNTSSSTMTEVSSNDQFIQAVAILCSESTQTKIQTINSEAQTSNSSSIQSNILQMTIQGNQRHLNLMHTLSLRIDQQLRYLQISTEVYRIQIPIQERKKIESSSQTDFSTSNISSRIMESEYEDNEYQSQQESQIKRKNKLQLNLGLLAVASSKNSTPKTESTPSASHLLFPTECHSFRQIKQDITQISEEKEMHSDSTNKAVEQANKEEMMVNQSFEMDEQEKQEDQKREEKYEQREDKEEHENVSYKYEIFTVNEYEIGKDQYKLESPGIKKDSPTQNSPALGIPSISSSYQTAKHTSLSASLEQKNLNTKSCTPIHLKSSKIEDQVNHSPIIEDVSQIENIFPLNQEEIGQLNDFIDFAGSIEQTQEEISLQEGTNWIDSNRLLKYNEIFLFKTIKIGEQLEETFIIWHTTVLKFNKVEKKHLLLNKKFGIKHIDEKLINLGNNQVRVHHNQLKIHRANKRNYFYGDIQDGKWKILSYITYTINHL